MVLTRRGKEDGGAAAHTSHSPFKLPSAPSPSRRTVAAEQGGSTPASSSTTSPTRSKHSVLSAVTKTRLPKSAATMQLRNRPRKEGGTPAGKSATALGKRRQAEEGADEWADGDDDKSGTSSPVNEFGRTRVVVATTTTPKAQPPQPRQASPTHSLTRSRSDRRILDTALPSMIPSSPSTKALAHKIRRGADISDVHANGKITSNPSPGSTSAIPKFGTLNGQRPKARLSAGIGRNTVTTMARFGLPVRDAKQRGGSAAAGVSPTAPMAPPPPPSSSSPTGDAVVQFGSMQQRNRRFSFTSQLSKPKNDSEKENRRGESTTSKSPMASTSPGISLSEQQSLRKLNRALGPPQTLQSRYGAQSSGPSAPSSSVKSKAALWEKSTSTPVQQSKRGGVAATKTQRRLSGNTHSLATKPISVPVPHATTSPTHSPFQHIPNPRPTTSKQQQRTQPQPTIEAEETLLGSSPGDETFDLRGLTLSPTPDSPVVNFRALLGGGDDDGSLTGIKIRTTDDLLKSSSDVDTADLPSLMSSLVIASSPPRQAVPRSSDADEQAAAIAASAWISPPPTPPPPATSHLETIIESQKTALADLQRRLEASEKRLAAQVTSSAENCALLETALQETEERLERRVTSTEELEQRLAVSEQSHKEELEGLQRLLEASERDAHALRSDSERIQNESMRSNARYDKVKHLASDALINKATMGWEMLLGAAWSEEQVVQEQMEMCRLLVHDLDLWEQRIRAAV